MAARVRPAARRAVAARSAARSWTACDGGRPVAGPAPLAWQRPTARRSASGGLALDGIEFTLSDYRDVPELGFNRGQEFSMLTLRHPAISQGAGRDALFEAKERDATEGVDQVFKRFAGSADGALQAEVLSGALAGIGLRPDHFTAAGILQRHAVRDPQHIFREEFDGVVREAWGKSRTVSFDDRLAQVHDGLQGHAPLGGPRALVFVGRNSPINWVMRLMKHSWPYALRRVVIMRNLGPNPELDPQLMEEFFPWVIRDYSRSNLTTASELAQCAAANASTTEGGFVVRLEGFSPDAPDIYAPLRGLPENAPTGVVANLWSRLSVFGT